MTFAVGISVGIMVAAFLFAAVCAIAIIKIIEAFNVH